MKNIYIYLALTLIIIQVSSCRCLEKKKYDSTRSNSYCISYEDSTGLITYCRYKDSLKNGKEYQFYKNGNIAVIGYYKRGLKNGKFIYYLPNGNVSDSKIFKKNKLIKLNIYNTVW